MVAKFQNALPGKFGPFVKGVAEDIVTNEKILALTFDACGGPHGNGYDEELIVWLRSQKIQATLFIGGLWIDAHPDLVKELYRIPCLKLKIMDSGIILVRSMANRCMGFAAPKMWVRP